MSAALTHAEPPPRVADQRVVLETDAGDIVLALYPDAAPKHVAQFLALVRLGVYDTTCFMRVLPGFIAQVSDATDRSFPLSPRQAAAIHPLKAEFSALRHRRGVLSMSRNGDDPDSARTSFSIMLGDWPAGDGHYTVFGRVQEGMSVLDEILKVPRDENSAPTERIEIFSATAVTAAQLARQSLTPAQPIEISPASAQASAQAVAAERNKVMLWGLAAMTLMSLVAYAVAVFFPAAAPTTILISVLIGVFLLFTVLTPGAHLRPILSCGIFLGLLAAFRLMGRFESSSQ